jgi:Tfp pilus assembly protein PilZ
MARRTTWRIPMRLDVRFNYYDKLYSGTVTNLSEAGMFISTHEKCFSKHSNCEITIPLKKEKLHVSARIIRLVNTTDKYKGVGVKLLNPPKNYLDFVDNLIYSL